MLRATNLLLQIGLAGAAISVATWCPSIDAQSADAPATSIGAISAYDLASNLDSPMRAVRSRRFNSNDPVPHVIDESSPRISLAATTSFAIEPPIALSDTIVVGHIIGAQSYLSEDRVNIYTEFRARVAEVLRKPEGLSLEVGSTIEMDRRGGAIRLPSGKVVMQSVMAQSMPKGHGRRYLFFLHYEPSSSSYSIVTGYDLAGDTVWQLDGASSSTLVPTGQTEAEFLSQIRTELKH